MDQTNNKIGTLFIISAPSGAGKSSLIAALRQKLPDIQLSVSFTTRPPRTGEVDGVNYRFIDRNEFLKLRQSGEFIESALVHDNYYGTSKTWMDHMLKTGHDVLLEIDWQGALQVKNHFSDLTSIFILPPSLEQLSLRLTSRNTDDPDVIAKRLEGASLEISHASEFDYVIINDHFETALRQLEHIISAVKLQFNHQAINHATLFAQLGIQL